MNKMNEKIVIYINGYETAAMPGETIAAVLISKEIMVFRHTEKCAPRGIFCGMGVCFDCLVNVDGVPDVRACVTEVRAGMRIVTGDRYD